MIPRSAVAIPWTANSALPEGGGNPHAPFRVFSQTIKEPKMDANRDDEIRTRAYQLWEEEGRPEGRAEQHWFTARESLAVEENHQTALLPIDTGTDAEPIEAVENAGEFPTLTDQGEQRIPRRPKTGDASQPANS